jgi:excinuclease ABC subunit C
MAESKQEQLESQIGRLPAGAGVYMFRDSRGRVLYVGKAKSLRARVRSYLSAERDPSPKESDPGVPSAVQHPAQG